MGTTTVTAFMMVLLVAAMLLPGCQSKPPVVVHTSVTSKGCPPAFVSEHNDLFAENIRLKHQLRLCQEKR